jgi:hypothetical protein
MQDGVLKPVREIIQKYGANFFLTDQIFAYFKGMNRALQFTESAKFSPAVPTLFLDLQGNNSKIYNAII